MTYSIDSPYKKSDWLGQFFLFHKQNADIFSTYTSPKWDQFLTKNCVWLVGWSKLMMTKSRICKKIETKSARPILIWSRYRPYLQKFKISDFPNSISWQGKFSKSGRNMFWSTLKKILLGSSFMVHGFTEGKETCRHNPFSK